MTAVQSKLLLRLRFDSFLKYYVLLPVISFIPEMTGRKFLGFFKDIHYPSSRYFSNITKTRKLEMDFQQEVGL